MNYLINSDQAIFVDKKVNEIITSLGLTKDDFNVSYFDCDNLSVLNLVDEASTFPFGSDNKVIIVKNPSFLGEKVSKSEAEGLTELLNYLDNPTDFTTIIFIEYAPIPVSDFTKKFRKSVKECEITKIEKKEKNEYIRRMFSSKNIRIDNDALNEFSKRVGEDFTAINNEIDKLGSYSNHITKQIVIDMISEKEEDNIFALTDGILSMNKNKALKVFRDLKANNYDTFFMITTVAKQIKFLYQVTYLLEQGESYSSIATTLNANPYRVEIVAKNGKSYTSKSLLEALSSLADLDVAIKSGEVDKDEGFEMFILRG